MGVNKKYNVCLARRILHSGKSRSRMSNRVLPQDKISLFYDARGLPNSGSHWTRDHGEIRVEMDVERENK